MQNKECLRRLLNAVRNDFFVPDNLYIGKGQILRPDGSFYKNDFEVGIIELRLPATPLNEVSINIFDKLIADRGDSSGFTSAGYNAMRYADCTLVKSTDLALNRVKFSMAIQAFNKSLDGYDGYDGYIDGYIVNIEDVIGAHMDYTTGILKLTLSDLLLDNVYLTLVNKIIITVFLKRAGWNNEPTIVLPTEIAGLIS